jgi:hypothetical protein
LTPAEAEPTEPRRAPRKPRRIGRLWLIVVAALAILALVMAIAYGARRDLARSALSGWLQERGIAAQIDIESFGPTSAVARIRAGTPGDPEFTVERAEINYGLLGLWSGDPFVEIRRVRLVRPILRGAFRDGKLTFGALDALIDEFRKRPPRPDARQPLILVEGGLIGLDTEYGHARLRGDARIEDNKLMDLEARLAPVAAKAGGVELAVRGGEISLKTQGDRVTFSVGAIVGQAKGEALEAEESFLRLTGEGPYPDLEKRRGDGALALTLTGGARRLEWAGTEVGGGEFTARFNGRASGWLDDLAIGGRGTLEGRAETGSAAGASVQRVTFEAEAPTLSWTRTGPDRLSAQGRLSARIGEIVQDELRLRQVAANFRGSAGGGVDQPARVHLTGGATARGSWRGLGPVAAEDDPGIAALKRTLGDFEVRAPAVSLDQTSDGLTVALGSPARLIGQGGGQLALSPRAGGAVYASGGGAFLLRASGGGLPEAEFAVDRYTASENGVLARGRGRFAGDFLLFRGADMQLEGSLRLRGGAVSVTTRGCTPLRAAGIELGENDLADVSGRFCATGAPMLTMTDGAWRLRGEIRGGTASAPFLQVRFDEADGSLDVGGKGDALTLRANLAAARVIDTTEPQRFFPVMTRGEASAARGVWRGRFDLATPSGHSLGEAVLQHADATESGSFQLDTGLLAFAPEGLQPADLSPAAVLIASPAEGEARFVGGFSWSPRGEASGGTLDVSRLDFRGPIGMVRGLQTRIELTSLAPLATAPDQVVRAERIEAFAPMTEIVAIGRVENEAIQLASAVATAGHGRIELEPMAIPFDPDATWRGAMRLDDVQLSDLVEASPLAEQMDLVAKVDGRIPFEVGSQGIKVSGGELHAIEPGRLSIQREALTSVAAEGGAPEDAEPNLTVDFAYQAMENLAFEQLAAEIETRPGGRLGVLFRIAGEHDPPRRQELRLGYLELIQRSFLNRSLPLPSGVKVDLSLDMSLNLDQLLADWNEYQRLIDGRGPGSATVQPDSANSASDSSPGGST